MPVLVAEIQRRLSSKKRRANVTAADGEGQPTVPFPSSKKSTGFNIAGLKKRVKLMGNN